MSIHKELSFVLPNKAGTLGKVASALAAKGVSLLSVDAAGGLDYNIVRIVPDNTNKALAILKKHRLEVVVGHVLCIKMSDKPGTLAKITRALGKAGVNIEYLYATGGRVGPNALIVLRTADNRKAQKVLSRIR